MGARTVALTGVAASGGVGTVDFAYVAFLSSVTGAGSVGSIASTNRTVALTGVSAQGQAGTASYFYWSLIDDNQTPNWSIIDDNQTPNWQNVPMTV
jgi:hypothetical protein